MINVSYIYSQRDTRWRDKCLGFSKLKIGSYGCTITALASFISHVYNERFTPEDINNRLKAVKAFSGALIIWYRVPIAFPKFKYIKRAYNYNNAEVAWYVYLKKTPVMVEVNAASIGAPRHWVLYLGSGKMIDPWYGRIDSTSKYPPTGYALYQTA